MAKNKNTFHIILFCIMFLCVIVSSFASCSSFRTDNRHSSNETKVYASNFEINSDLSEEINSNFDIDNSSSDDATTSLNLESFKQKYFDSSDEVELPPDLF